MAFRVWNFVPMTPIDWIGVGLGGSTSPIHITFLKAYASPSSSFVLGTIWVSGQTR